ncbi:MAG: hypothetical protein DMF53_08975 [Acidobacteria bacterium]|nr:MAG: hypothetical protein DMF53_08975 [Acidobacteriota bacterium]
MKLGLGALIALSTLVAPAASHAAGALCIFSFTNQSGATCTYAGTEGNCCVYTSNDGSHCNKICNPPA